MKNDHRQLANVLSKEYIGCVFSCYEREKDCGYSKSTKFYIRVIEVPDDFNIQYGYHFDKDMNFLGYGYLPQEIRTDQIFQPIMAVSRSRQAHT